MKFVFLLFSTLCFSAYVPAQEESPAPVLMLYSYSYDIPWNVSFRAGLKRELSFQSDNIRIYEEFLDADHFSSADYYQAFHDYLSAKYRDLQPQVVMADSTPALDFLSTYPQLFKGSQRILFQTDSLDKHQTTEDSDWSINIVTDFTTSLENALALTSATDVYVVVDTMEAAGRSRLSAFRQQSAALVKETNLHILENQPLPVLKEQLANLPEKSLVYDLLMFSDMEGQHMAPFQVAQRLSAVSSAPIFSHWESLMGSGITGGYMISSQSVGGLAVRSASAFVKGETLHLEKDDGFHYVYDWMALNRFRISTSPLPENAIYVNKPDSLLRFYRWHILTAVVVACVLSIISFLFYRRLLSRKINAKMLVLANTDSLTGLKNRRAIHPLIKHSMESAKRYSTPVSMLLLDIDYFKKVNDEYGHIVGDQVLTTMAEILRTSVRSVDSVCRWGGEEFMVLADSTVAEKATELAEKLRDRVAQAHFNKINSVTISVGVSQYRPGESFSVWYDRTDSALYDAKHAGRNRVEIK